jgi:predicted DNA binding CopG/RHH family protein
MLVKESKKDEKMYKKNEWNVEWSLKAAKRIQKKRKTPTSIALSPETVVELKELAEKKGIPYQVLMRSFILEGLRKAKKAS